MSAPPASTGWQRSRRIAGFLATGASVYAGVSYVLGQLGEEREHRRQQEKSRENLRLRFTELQDNSNFTVMMLLPNVAAQIFAALDVEGITAALQQKTAASKALLNASTTSLNGSFDKLTSSETQVNGTNEPEVSQTEGDGLVNGTANPSPPAPPPPPDEASHDAIASSQELASSALGLSGAVRTPYSLCSTGCGVAYHKQQLPPVDQTRPAEPERPLDPRTKLELWQEIKVLAFTRTVAALYLVTILTLQTAVTLNLLGRADYLASVVDLARDRGKAGQIVVDDLVAAYAALPATAADSDGETDQKFLTFSWYLLHRGWPLLVDRVRQAVDELVGGHNLKAPITYDELCELFDRIRERVDSDGPNEPFNFMPVYFPTTEAEEILTLTSGGIAEDRACIDDRLRVLLDETRNFLASDDGCKVQRKCLDASFTRMTNSLDSAFKPGPLPAPATSAAEAKQTSKLTQIGGRSARLANLLPSIAKASHAVLEGFPNEYVEELKDVHDLKAFSAIVFSTFR